MLNQRTHSKRVEYGGYTVGLQQSPQHWQRLSTSLQTVVYSLCYIVSVVVYLTGHATLTQRQTTLTLYGRIKTQSNGPLYSNTLIGIHWPLMGGLLHLVQRRGAWAGCGPAQSTRRCTKCNNPPINDQCTNFILFDVAL